LCIFQQLALRGQSSQAGTEPDTGRRSPAAPPATGLLSQAQLLNFFQYCASKCGHSPATAQLLEGQKQSALAQLAPEQPVNLEQFVQLFR
jgi:hypothetical protein